MHHFIRFYALLQFYVSKVVLTCLLTAGCICMAPLEGREGFGFSVRYMSPLASPLLLTRREKRVRGSWVGIRERSEAYSLFPDGLRVLASLGFSALALTNSRWVTPVRTTR